MKQFIILSILLCLVMHSVCQKELDPFDPKIKPFKENNKYGFKNQRGRIKIPAKYDKVGFFQNGLASVYLNNQVALINKSGKTVVPFGAYDKMSSSRNGIIRVVKENKFGFLDVKGKEIIPCIFDKADFFRNGRSLVRKNNKEGIINIAGAEIIPIIYDKLIPLASDSLMKIENDGKWGYLDYSGRIFVNAEFDELDKPLNGMIRVKKDGKYGFLNDKGDLVIPCKYDRAGPFTESGTANITLERKNGVVSKDGKENFPE